MKSDQRNSRKNYGKRWMMLSLFLSATMFAMAQEPVQLNLKDALNYALKSNQNAKKSKP